MSAHSHKDKQNSQNGSSQSWSSCIGLREILAQVAQQMRDNRLQQITLFHGRTGLGKSHLLDAAAALTFCQQGTACGSCPPCHDIQNRTHPDVLWVTTEGKSLKLEDGDKIQEHLSLFPHERRPGAHFPPRRIVLLADAEQLTLQAMNRLLKLFEEPPASAQVYLSTSRKDLLLPTLLSRCSMWPVSPPQRSSIEEWLRNLPEWQKRDSTLQTVAKAEELLRRCSFAPGQIKKTLEEEEKVKEWQRLCQKLISPEDALSALTTAKDIAAAGGDMASLFFEIEYALNLKYRHSQGDIKNIGPRRAWLHHVKLQALRKRIALNQQLLCEQLGMLCGDTSIGEVP